MLDQDTIEQQQTLLVENRRRLAHLVRQQAKLGTHTPHYIVADIEEAQAAIRNLKEELRAESARCGAYSAAYRAS